MLGIHCCRVHTAQYSKSTLWSTPYSTVEDYSVAAVLGIMREPERLLGLGEGRGSLVHCSTLLQCTAAHCYTAVSALQKTATLHCSTLLQCTAAHCYSAVSALQKTAILHCSTLLQCTAAHCYSAVYQYSTVQCSVAHCYIAVSSLHKRATVHCIILLRCTAM